jgi:hypothetical protein
MLFSAEINIFNDKNHKLAKFFDTFTKKIPTSAFNVRKIAVRAPVQIPN